MKKIINWKLFFILLAACVIGSVLVLPYSLSLTSGGSVEELPIEGEVPVWLIVLSAILNSLIMFSVVTFLRFVITKKSGLENGG